MGIFDIFKSKKASVREVKKAPVEVKEMSLNLSKRVAKSTEELTLCLKKNSMEGIKTRVQVCIDESGSMEWENLYSGGVIQRVVERLVPLGLKFDDDKMIECYTFNTSCRKHDDISILNLDGYVRNTIGRIDGGGTKYAPVINAMVEGHINTQKKMDDGLPTFILMITDGQPSDKYESEKAIIEASKHNVFFMAIGIGDENFDFLQKLDDLKGREKDNCDFEAIKNIDSISDNHLYNVLMREFKGFVLKK